METEIMNSTDIRSIILQCSYCDRYWRAPLPERCIHCAREYGLPYTLDPLRRLALFEAIQTISLDTVMPFPGPQTDEDKENALQFAIALEDNCSWYDYEDPVCVQTCWLALQERCPWADIDATAQAKWDALIGEFKPIPVAPSQITYASLYFDLDFQECAHRIAELDEDYYEKWAAYLEKKKAAADL